MAVAKAPATASAAEGASWHENYAGAPTNELAWLRGGQPSFRVIRGGSWRNEGELLRAAVRDRRNINLARPTMQAGLFIHPHSYELSRRSHARHSL